MPEYVYGTKPFFHQKIVFEASRDIIAYGLWWEQGTGKSKTIVDTGCWLYLGDEIDTVITLSPGGIRYVWADQFVTHASPNAAPSIRNQVLTSGTFARKWFTHEWAVSLAHDGLLVVSLSYNTLTTEAGGKIIASLLKARPGKTLLVMDEVTKIKTPKAQRTKRVRRLAKRVKYTRALTGTIVDNSPFDIYSPVEILTANVEFWKSLGLNSFMAFKARYGVWAKGYNGKTGREYPVLVKYARMDELKERLALVGNRVTKDEALDLPPKLYSTVPFDMSPKQRAAYNSLRDEFLLLLSRDDDEQIVSAPLAIVRMIRLQQITSGYVGTDDGELVDIDDTNARLKCLESILEDIGNQVIIWCRFTRDVDLITEMLGKNCVRYDGGTSNADRLRAIERFQNGDVQYFVSNPECAGEGITLHAARTVIYYANTFKLSSRLQSEDRAHRIGQEHPVSYIDIYARDTIDKRIVESLVAKKRMADYLQGDTLKDWLEIV